MYKIILFFFCALFLLLDLEPARADAPDTPPTEATASADPRVPRPNYKRYRGNSRTRSKRMGFLRRRAARRKAMRLKKGASRRKGVISVEKAQGAMPKK